jgi:hypothetical protein
MIGLGTPLVTKASHSLKKGNQISVGLAIQENRSGRIVPLVAGRFILYLPNDVVHRRSTTNTSADEVFKKRSKTELGYIYMYNNISVQSGELLQLT